MANYCDNLEQWEQREDPNNFHKEWEDDHIRNQKSIRFFKCNTES